MVPEVSMVKINDFYEEYGHYAGLDRYFTMLQYRISLSSAEELSTFYGGDEGLENLLLKKIRLASSYEGLVDAMTSKRYPASRIRRYLLAILLSYTKETAQSFKTKGPAYLKPLGFNTRGQDLLKEMKRQATLPVLSNIAKAVNSPHPLPGLALDLRASDIYRLGLNGPTPLGTGVRMTPIKG
jgi:predicted nucleotidyltransferase